MATIKDVQTNLYVIGGVLGIILLVVIIALIILYIWIRKLASAVKNARSNEPNDAFVEHEHANMNSAFGMPLNQPQINHYENPEQDDLYKIRRAQLKHEDVQPSWLKPMEPVAMQQQKMGNNTNQHWPRPEVRRQAPTGPTGFQNARTDERRSQQVPASPGYDGGNTPNWLHSNGREPRLNRPNLDRNSSRPMGQPQNTDQPRFERFGY